MDVDSLKKELGSVFIELKAGFKSIEELVSKDAYFSIPKNTRHLLFVSLRDKVNLILDVFLQAQYFDSDELKNSVSNLNKGFKIFSEAVVNEKKEEILVSLDNLGAVVSGLIKSF
ncbi:hypothetical protein K9L97_02625 [Candidatus Woesearchaeota archaeon]|nr:hypothetical protein [Candidatus Woesearchaeota archaeon]